MKLSIAFNRKHYFKHNIYKYIKNNIYKYIKKGLWLRASFIYSRQLYRQLMYLCRQATLYPNLKVNRFHWLDLEYRKN